MSVHKAYRAAGRGIVRHALSLDEDTITIGSVNAVAERSRPASAGVQPWPLPGLLHELTAEWAGHLAAARVGECGDDRDLDEKRRLVIKALGETVGQACISRGGM
jgi:hypothetical protein